VISSVIEEKASKAETIDASGRQKVEVASTKVASSSNKDAFASNRDSFVSTAADSSSIEAPSGSIDASLLRPVGNRTRRWGADGQLPAFGARFE
jgi:hypothetical protein